MGNGLEFIVGKLLNKAGPIRIVRRDHSGREISREYLKEGSAYHLIERYPSGKGFRTNISNTKGLARVRSREGYVFVSMDGGAREFEVSPSDTRTFIVVGDRKNSGMDDKIGMFYRVLERPGVFKLDEGGRLFLHHPNPHACEWRGDEITVDHVSLKKALKEGVIGTLGDAVKVLASGIPFLGRKKGRQHRAFSVLSYDVPKGRLLCEFPLHEEGVYYLVRKEGQFDRYFNPEAAPEGESIVFRVRAPRGSAGFKEGKVFIHCEGGNRGEVKGLSYEYVAIASLTGERCRYELKGVPYSQNLSYWRDSGRGYVKIGDLTSSGFHIDPSEGRRWEFASGNTRLGFRFKR